MSNYSGNSFLKIVWFHFLTWLEKISYGLYLTHIIALNIIIAIFIKEADFVLLKNVSFHLKIDILMKEIILVFRCQK
jgi:peptidoglycan/LPS O-acetylase OafA/YrhL